MGNGKKAGAVLLSCVMAASVMFPPGVMGMAQQAEAADGTSIVPVYDEAAGKVTVAAPEGYTVENNGADFEQVVADDFSVHQPLTDKEVKLALKITDPEGNTEISDEYTLQIPGVHEESAGNAKPQVIPEIAEWYSGSAGQFTMKDSSKIIISSEDLRYVGEEFRKDLADLTGKELSVTVGTKAAAEPGDFYFSLGSGDEMLGEEGYAMEIGAFADTEGVEAKGVYWATRTILQMIKLSEDGSSMPQGEMRDYPKYEVRSFVFDVGRKPVSLDTLKEIAKNMAWYKMNDFQVHLNDNTIFLEDYYNSEEPDPADAFQAYTGFRLESAVANEEGTSIASEDYHYTKEEFHDFIQECRLFGVDIVPEIDVPAHALAITEVFPEYAVYDWNPRNSQRSVADHLDISKPEAVELTKSIFADYTVDGTFDSDTIIHIGADEFEASATAYREFLNEMLPYIKETNTVRLWGGLTWIKDNKTEITPEAIEGSQINLWSKDWADGQDMYDMGFDLINTLDYYGYMVPSGDGSRGMYNDYLDKNLIFREFKPNRVRCADGSFVELPSGDKQVLGGAFALWQDNTDTRAHGLSEEDLFIRFFDALPVYAEKTWANGQEKGSAAAIDALAQKISTAPNTNPYHQEASDDGVYEAYDFEADVASDGSLMGRDLEGLENAGTVTAEGNTALKLNGGSSYAQTPLDTLGSTGKKSLSFTLKLDEVTPGQILFEADAAYGTHDIRITENHKLGFTRELFTYEFDYELTPGKTEEIEIVTGQQKTSLYVDGVFVADAVGQFANKGIVKKSGITNSSFALPLQRIGSATNAIKGTLDNIRAEDEEASWNPVPSEGFSVTSDNENAFAYGKEGPAYLAFDGNTATHWHSNYTPKQELPASITVDMGAEYEIEKMLYLPRQDGQTNGIITAYTLSVSPDGEEYRQVAAGTLADDAAQKEIAFDAVKARYVKFTATEGKGGFASAAEITFCRAADRTELQAAYESCKNIENQGYTEESWKAFQEALSRAEAILAREKTYQATADAALAELQKAKEGLFQKPAEPDRTGLQAAYNSYAALVSSGYTEDSWKAFAAALENAQAVLSDSSATQEAMDKALADLETAKNSLAKAPVPEKPSTPVPSEPGAPALPKKGSTYRAGKLQYKVTSSTESAKTVSVTAAVKKTAGKITVPAQITIQGYVYKVTAIANKAFSKNTKLKTVVIGANVTSIGKDSFSGCKNLKSVTVNSAKIKSIGKNAFKGISPKAKIKVPKARLAAYKKYLRKARLDSKVKVVKK